MSTNIIDFDISLSFISTKIIRTSSNDIFFKGHKGKRNFEKFGSLLCTGLASSGRKDDSHNETVESKCFSKNEDKNHTHEQLWLLSISPENNPTKSVKKRYHLTWRALTNKTTVNTNQQTSSMQRRQNKRKQV